LIQRQAALAQNPLLPAVQSYVNCCSISSVLSTNID